MTFAVDHSLLHDFGCGGVRIWPAVARDAELTIADVAGIISRADDAPAVFCAVACTRYLVALARKGGFES